MSLGPSKVSMSRSSSSSSAGSPSSVSGGVGAIKPFPIRRDPCLSRSFRGHQGAVRCVSFCPILVRASETGLPSYRYASDQYEETVERLSTVSGRARAERLAQTNVQQLASGSEDHSVMIWHCKPHLRAFRFVGHTQTVNAVEWAKDASVVASASDDQTVRVWTPNADGVSTVLRSHVGSVRCVSFATDPHWLLSSADDQMVKLWDLEKNVAYSHFHGHLSSVPACTFSNDMRLVATGGQDRSTKIFDTHTQHCLATLYENQGSVTSVQFHPHGGILSTCSADGSIKLWDLRTLRMLQHYSAHDAPVTSIHFHPSGDYLLSTGMDAAVKIWDLKAGHQLFTLHGHPSAVYSGRFSADGSTFITGGADQRVIIWNSNLDQGKKGTHLNSALPVVGNVAINYNTKLKHEKIPQNVPDKNKREKLYASLAAQAAAASSPSQPTTSFIRPLSSGPLPPSAHDHLASEEKKAQFKPSQYKFVVRSEYNEMFPPPPTSTESDAVTGEEVVDEHGHLLSSEYHHCDYQHTHTGGMDGSIHSYANKHDPALFSKAQHRKSLVVENTRKKIMPPKAAKTAFEEEMGYASSTTASSSSSQTSVIPSTSPLTNATQRAEEKAQVGIEVGMEQTPHHQFSSKTAILGGHDAQQHTSRQPTNSVHLAHNSAGDDYVFDYLSDRFQSLSSLASSQGKLPAVTSEGVPLKGVSSVDVRAVPPADHIQRLPEQLAHTLRYMTAQLQGIQRSLSSFEYRLNVQEQKVDRLAKQQDTWEWRDKLSATSTYDANQYTQTSDEPYMHSAPSYQTYPHQSYATHDDHYTGEQQTNEDSYQGETNQSTYDEEHQTNQEDYHQTN